MTREEILSEVEEIFRDVLDEDDLEILEQTTVEDVDDWDSLTHINLVVAIEKKYKIRFSLADLDGLKNVGDMVDLILSKKS